MRKVILSVLVMVLIVFASCTSCKAPPVNGDVMVAPEVVTETSAPMVDVAETPEDSATAIFDDVNVSIP